MDSPWIHPWILTLELLTVVQSLHCWMWKPMIYNVLKAYRLLVAQLGMNQTVFSLHYTGSWRKRELYTLRYLLDFKARQTIGDNWYSLMQGENRAIRFQTYFFLLLSRLPVLSLCIEKDLIPKESGGGRCSSGTSSLFDSDAKRGAKLPGEQGQAEQRGESRNGMAEYSIGPR